MSAPADSMQNINATGLIKEEDQGIYQGWLKLKEELVEINNIPRHKTAERKRRADIALKKAINEFLDFFIKYPSLLIEYKELTQALAQYSNAQIEPLEQAAKDFFKAFAVKNGQTLTKEPEFFPKKGGDQLGRRMRMEYEDKEAQERRTIDFYIKTHQGGAKTGQSSVRHVDPKELFVYKVLEYTGLGPKAHFFFNLLSPGGFYIATQDCGYAKSLEKQQHKKYLTIGAFKEEKEKDPKSTEELIQKMNDVIYSGFACADILSRVFCLRDVLTNSGNSGFIIKDNSYKFKIIDFSVIDTFGTYSSDSIAAGYLSGNGVFNYIDDEFLKKYLRDVTEQQKVEIGLEVQNTLFSRTGTKLSLMEAIDKAMHEIIQFVHENHRNLGINDISAEENHDFNRYVRDVKFNLTKFVQDLEQVKKNKYESKNSKQNQESSSSDSAFHTAEPAPSSLSQYHQYLQQQNQPSQASSSLSNKMDKP